jgi:hypothetical protein
MRKRLAYTSAGYLRGKTPNGRLITVGHEQPGRTRYRLFWQERWHTRFGQTALSNVFGIAPREKRTGGQEGYPAEPVIRAVWRHFVDRYNEGDPGVVYSHSFGESGGATDD